jgi:HPt (histidine-containing phosphotransfer) domain-containing protein
MNKSRSIESHLVALSVAAASLFGVLLLTLFGVQQALGSSVERLSEGTLPAQRALTEFEAALADLFARDIRVLGASSLEELGAEHDRSAIDARLADARRALEAGLPALEGALRARQHSGALTTQTRELLESDRELYASVERTQRLREALSARSSELQEAVQQLVQHARALAGQARLSYVLELRALATAPSSAAVRSTVYGPERVQQEAAEHVVAAVLQLGQLAGRIALVRHEDELNSVSANELAQSLARARGQLDPLVDAVAAGSPLAQRAEELQREFEDVARRISDTDDPESLLSVRRGMLEETAKRSELQAQIQREVEAFGRSLDAVQAAVSREAARTTQQAGRAMLLVRSLTLLVWVAALWGAWRAARRVRASLSDLRRQNAQLERLSGDLQRMNDGLEQTAAERSAELLRRERAMRLILDAMDEGLVIVDRDGALSGQCSRSALAWFGEPPAGAFIWDYLLESPIQREQFKLGFEQACEDVLPFEVCVSAMPERFSRAGRTYSLGYRQVFEGERFSGILNIVKDVTLQLDAERREREAREQHTMLANLLRDKQGFQVFVRECAGMIAELRELPERSGALRALHILKGSAAVYGMDSVARYCHQLEDQLAERSGSLTDHEARELANLWRARLEKIGEVVAAEETLELHATELGDLIHGLHERRDYEELLELVDSWKWIKTSSLLGRLAGQVREFAKRLDKAVEVHIEHNDLRVLPGDLDDFWSALVHVTRNAVDHGIESEAERIALNKPVPARIALRTLALPQGAGFAVEIEDDGRGIDFSNLRKAAQRAQLRATTDSDVVEAMFHDGVTSRAESSEPSGRGIGLTAVAAASRSNGGSVQVSSEPGRGTLFRFEFSSQKVRIRQLPANFPRVHLSVRPPALAS